MSVIDDKDPVGNGKGGVDGGDDDGADFLDLLLGSALPHALHQLGHSPLPDDKEDGEDAEEGPDVEVGDVGHLDDYKMAIEEISDLGDFGLEADVESVDGKDDDRHGSSLLKQFIQLVAHHHHLAARPQGDVEEPVKEEDEHG